MEAEACNHLVTRYTWNEKGRKNMKHKHEPKDLYTLIPAKLASGQPVAPQIILHYKSQHPSACPSCLWWGRIETQYNQLRQRLLNPALNLSLKLHANAASTSQYYNLSYVTVSKYLSQEGQMLHNEMGTFGLPGAAFSTDDYALMVQNRRKDA